MSMIDDSVCGMQVLQSRDVQLQWLRMSLDVQKNNFSIAQLFLVRDG
jgi:hypothetical protein